MPATPLNFRKTDLHRQEAPEYVGEDHVTPIIRVAVLDTGSAFVPEAGKAVAEMRRVVRPGGVVAAAVWDHLGGMPGMRMMWDTLAAQDENASRLRGQYFFKPMTRPGEMKESWIEHGLVGVEQTSLLIRMEYQSFDDFWEPIAADEGPLGRYVASLNPAAKARADQAVRAAYEAGQPDGPRSFASVAWACRGVVPPA